MSSYCIDRNCTRQSSFNYKNCNVGLYCILHKKSGMRRVGRAGLYRRKSKLLKMKTRTCLGIRRCI